MHRPPQGTLEDMEGLLRHCRRRIMRADMAVRLRESLALYLACLPLIGGLFLLYRAAVFAAGIPPAIRGVHVLGFAGLLALLVFGRAVWRSLFTRPVRTADAAERLDLSQATHNRIASAIALLRAGDDSSFARAAIRDGHEHLESLQDEAPYVDTSSTSWRRKGVHLAAALGLLLAGLFMEAAPRPSGDGDLDKPEPLQMAGLEPRSKAPAPEPETAVKRRAPARGERQPTRDTPPPEDTPGDIEEGRRPKANQETLSEGPAGQHASGRSRISQSSSASRSTASGAGVQAEPGETEPGKNKKPREVKKQKTAQPDIDQKNKKGGSINARGSSGTGSMRTAQNEWSSKVKAKSNEEDDFEQEEEPDEEMDPDKQRQGAQPALKNRTSRVSRELSLSMGTGLSKDMMKGRGGPSAQKKARGTATMILGVPVPGFVKGRLLPGPTKSTQEEVEPSPREGDYATRSDLLEARPQERPQERYRPPASLGPRARDYLITYHADHETQREP